MATIKKIYGYARVSSRDQNLDRQIKSLLAADVEERDIITDKISGKSLEREGYKMLKERMLRNGDTLVIDTLDRLSRKKAHIKEELEYYKKRSIRVKILDIPTSAMEFPPEQAWIQDMVNSLIIEVLASIAEHERDTIRKRQAEGIAVAKEKGKHLGRPRLERPENWDEVYQKWIRKKITAVDAMALLGLKRSSFYKLVHEQEESD